MSSVMRLTALVSAASAIPLRLLRGHDSSA
jgi:hypothetical protein